MMRILDHSLPEAACRLHAYLQTTHWDGHVLKGADYGIRFNARIGRFIKSYLAFLRWSDHYAYAQAQKYWIIDNWLMADLHLSNPALCQHIAVACTETLLAMQHPEGYWPYPNPEWRHRIATVEGNYAAMGLLETYLRTQHEPFLTGAKKWYDYVMQHVGFQGENGLRAINYFANLSGARVPNNSASALRTFALLAQATGDDQYLAQCRGMVAWLKDVQLPTGELPYAVQPPGSVQKKDRIHFLCYQYNAFQFLNIADYYRLTEDQEVRPLLAKLAAFVSTGMTVTGAARYNCQQDTPEVSYYTAALAAALSQAAELGLGDYRPLADRAYGTVLSQQQRDGRLSFFSRGNYGFLTDRRSYPRSQSMVLYHLLLAVRQFTVKPELV
jgi:hypothetical protein